MINGVNHWLWRGFDANGDVLDILARAAAAQDKSSQALLQEADRALWQAKGCGHRQARQLHQANPEPCSTGRSQADQRAHKGLNTRIEGSHRPTRKREKMMGRFKSPRQANASCPPMIRSTRSSDPAAITSPPAHTTTHEQAPSVCGTTIVAKWSPEIATTAPLKAALNNLAMPQRPSLAVTPAALTRHSGLGSDVTLAPVAMLRPQSRLITL